MSLRISGKHMDIGDAFRSRIEQRVGEAIDKYFDGGFSGHVTVAKSGARFAADCMVRLDTGMALQSGGESQEPVAAFEIAAERLEKRLRRYKRRLKAHHVPALDSIDVSYQVIAPVAEEDDEVPVDYAPAVVAESTLSLGSMSVAAAVIELDTKDDPVVVFRNAGSGQVNVVYRRADGNIGWIDPSAAKAANG
ncbi:MAG: ribosome-associated translation inhibitor RaiA [Rhizobiaceae bacterium]|nr:ribosome-associated translation inhibitor RaiA [Rhizobiaceae bacterium]